MRYTPQRHGSPQVAANVCVTSSHLAPPCFHDEATITKAICEEESCIVAAVIRSSHSESLSLEVNKGNSREPEKNKREEKRKEQQQDN